MPADYGVDTFAPAVNSRGDVASIDAGGRFDNGFLPRSVEHRRAAVVPDQHDQPRPALPGAARAVMVFVRLQVLPRWGGDGAGNVTSLFVEQAFGRVTPLEGRELFIAGGKFDSVFGIEYLDNAVDLPHRHHAVAVRALHDRDRAGAQGLLPPADRGASGRRSASTSPPPTARNFVEALQPPDVSLTGVPVLSGRLGYELNLPRVQVKLGASGLRGPRNDQFDRNALLTMWGVDARLYVVGLSLAGEYVYVDEEEGRGRQADRRGRLSDRLGVLRAAGSGLRPPTRCRSPGGALRAVTLYARYERRHA